MGYYVISALKSTPLSLLYKVLLFTAVQSCYVTKQAFWQNNLFNSRKEVRIALKDPNVSESEKTKLLYFQKVVAYAEQAGLFARGSYSHYIQNKDPVVSYTVQAAYKEKLEPLTYWFPIIGRVPYLGFFSKEERDEVAGQLKNDGFDIDKGGATAFSGLGWFEDPIYKSMLNSSLDGLSALVFHELTHKNLWFPGQSQFNEQLASFIEDHLNRLFLMDNGFKEPLERYQKKTRRPPPIHRLAFEPPKRIRNSLCSQFAPKYHLDRARKVVY